MRMVLLRFILAGLFLTMTTMVFVNSCQLSAIKSAVESIEAEKRDTVINFGDRKLYDTTGNERIIVPMNLFTVQ